MKNLKPLDKYRLKLRIFALGSLVWKILVSYSKLVLGIFVLVTCILFWSLLGVYLITLGTDFSGYISVMFKIVIIGVGIIIINEVVKEIINLRKK